MESLSKYYRHLLTYVSCSDKCTGQFRVTQTQLNHGGNDNEEHDDLSENNPRNHGEVNEDHEAAHEEIFSPAWYAIYFVCDASNDNGRYSQAGGKSISPDSGSSKLLQNDDGIQFYRRIRVVCMNLTGQVRLNLNEQQWGTSTNIFSGEYFEDTSDAAVSLLPSGCVCCN